MVTSVIFVKSATSEMSDTKNVSSASKGLSSEGRVQAAKTAKFLEGAGFSKVFVSDSLSARETAGIISDNELIVCDELFEFNKIVFEEEPEKIDFFNENIEKALNTKAFFEELLRSNRDSKILIVAHGNVIRCLTCHALKLKPQKAPNIFINNSSVTHLFFDGSDLISVGCVNSTAHLFLE